MRTTRNKFRSAAIALALSIAATPGLVNGQADSLTSVNSDKSSTGSDLKDSVKDAKADIAKLYSAVLKAGTNEKIRSNLAPVIGLAKPMSTKDVTVPLSQNASATETRRCFVVYEVIEGSIDMRPVCAYVARVKRAGTDKETRYFRMDLNGKLDKVVHLRGKFDESGKAVPGSGVKTDPEIDSPEVQKAFEAEMKFWLKDWLKKQDASPKPA